MRHTRIGKGSSTSGINDVVPFRHPTESKFQASPTVLTLVLFGFTGIILHAVGDHQPQILRCMLTDSVSTCFRVWIRITRSCWMHGRYHANQWLPDPCWFHGRRWKPERVRLSENVPCVDPGMLHVWVPPHPSTNYTYIHSSTGMNAIMFDFIERKTPWLAYHGKRFGAVLMPSFRVSLGSVEEHWFITYVLLLLSHWCCSTIVVYVYNIIVIFE